MGGWLHQPAPGLPQWGPGMDFNVQWDTRAAEVVAATARLTLVTLPVTLNAHLRRTDLPRLRAAGPLGQLLARQSEAHGQTHQMEKLGRGHAGLPDDLLNFQYDPVACAVALGWSAARVEVMRMRPVRRDGGCPSRLIPKAGGRGLSLLWTVPHSARHGYPQLREPHATLLDHEHFQTDGNDPSSFIRHVTRFSARGGK